MIMKLYGKSKKTIAKPYIPYVWYDGTDACW